MRDDVQDVKFSGPFGSMFTLRFVHKLEILIPIVIAHFAAQDSDAVMIAILSMAFTNTLSETIYLSQIETSAILRKFVSGTLLNVVVILGLIAHIVHSGLFRGSMVERYPFRVALGCSVMMIFLRMIALYSDKK